MPRPPDTSGPTEFQRAALAQVDEAIRLVERCLPLVGLAGQKLSGLTGIAPEARRAAQLSDELGQFLASLRTARKRGGVDLSTKGKAEHQQRKQQKEQEGGHDEDGL